MFDVQGPQRQTWASDVHCLGMLVYMGFCKNNTHNKDSTRMNTEICVVGLINSNFLVLITLVFSMVGHKFENLVKNCQKC